MRGVLLGRPVLSFQNPNYQNCHIIFFLQHSKAYVVKGSGLGLERIPCLASPVPACESLGQVSHFIHTFELF